MKARSAAQPRRRTAAPSPQEERRRRQRQRLAEQKRRQEAAKQRAAQQRALSRREALKKMGILLYVCALFCVLSLVVVGYARIAALKMENNALAASIQTCNAQIDELQLELSQKTDLQYIREQAAQRLNMGYPKAYQILEIELADQSAETAVGTGMDTSALVAMANDEN